MNQIIYPNDNIIIENYTEKKQNQIISKSFRFKILFIFSSISLIIFIIYCISFNYEINKKENLSKNLYDNFSIKTLYSSSNSYNTNLDVNNYVIGIIEINSLGINYPIISEYTDENLKISPCKFYGPLPNEIGNLCIAAHNYNNYKFFSKINKLNIDDKISIYDLSGKKIDYYVYKNYEVNYDDLECINQETNGYREITLVTCNNMENEKRFIIKAKEQK